MVLTHTRACGISHCSQKNYVNSRRLNKEHVGCLLNVSTGKADVVKLPLPQSSWPACLEARFEQVKNYQRWMRIKTGILLRT